MDRIDVLGAKLRAMEAECLRRGEPAEFTLFVLDWSKFFRLLPTDLTEAGAVWGQFGRVAMIDVTASMGSRSSPAFACTLGRGFHQAFRDRLREVTPQRLCDMGTYVDDCAVICITRHADWLLARLHHDSESLGLRVSVSKARTQDLSPATEFVGYSVDASSMRVSLTDHKQQ